MRSGRAEDIHETASQDRSGRRADEEDLLSSNANMYENNLLRRTTGNTLRPGGYRLTDWAAENCGFQSGDSILDVGCGCGATVNRLRTIYQLKAYGIDPSKKLLAIGKEAYPDLPLVQGAGEAIPFEDSSMNGIFAECSLSLMEDVERTFREMNRVLKPTGQLIIHDIYARNPQGVPDLQELNLNSCLRNALIREELEEKLMSKGFQITQWQDHSPLLAQLTMEIIMSHGSMNEFWLKSTACPADSGKVQAALKKARVGYFQLVARKL